MLGRRPSKLAEEKPNLCPFFRFALFVGLPVCESPAGVLSDRLTVLRPALQLCVRTYSTWVVLACGRARWTAMLQAALMLWLWL